MEIVTRAPANEKEWTAYYDLRFRVLREPWGQPRGSERNDGDLKAIHFASYIGNELRAIARADVLSPAQIQVRFVATEKKQQGKGYGKIVMKAIENHYQGTLVKEIILHSRAISVPFYNSIGYSTRNKSYLLFDEIQHFLMTKSINNES